MDAVEERISDNEEVIDVEIEVTPEPEAPEPDNFTESNNDKCNNCKGSTCYHGRYLSTHQVYDDIAGSKVKHVEYHQDKVGEVVRFQDGILTVKWPNKKNSKNYQFIKGIPGAAVGEFQFKFWCFDIVEMVDTSSVIVEEEVETEDINCETKVDEDMIFLAKPGAVVDIEEKENDDDALESEIDS